MKTYLFLALFALAILAFTACPPPATNTNVANTNTNTNANTSTAPTAAELKAIETKAYEAYKNKDGQYFQTLMTDNFTMTGEKGEKMDKPASIKMISEHPCQINGFTLSDEKVTPVGPNAAVLTTTAAADGTCEGKPIPTTTASTLYVNVGGQWKAAYHGEIPKKPEGTSDSNSNTNAANKPAANNSNAAKPAATAAPKPTATAAAKTPTPAASPASNTTASSNSNSNSNSNANATGGDLTTTLAFIEKSGWQAWKDKQAGPLEEALAPEFVYIDMNGKGFWTKADVIRDWTMHPCDVKAVSIENPQTVQVTENVALLTYKGTSTGTCEGTPLKPILGTTIFRREGTGWKAVYGTGAEAPKG